MSSAPDIYRAYLSKVLRFVPGGGRHCVACDSRVWTFGPYRGGARSQPQLMRALKVIGSDLDNHVCPRCGSHDRERHLIHYMGKMNLFERMRGASVLHFAPERHLAQHIMKARPEQYVKGDLYPSGPGIMRIDLLSLPFADNSFDFIFANHVLEHVSDDRAGLAEIYRVIKPGGLSILQTPYSARLANTWEDSGVDDDVARLAAFGQEDHLRLYGRDIVKRFTDSGLISRFAKHSSALPEIDATREGLNADEPFFLFQKPAEDEQP